MARRGGELREHILWTAKDVFLEMGFERASMDVVAERAATSKRSLYAHYESKDKLFVAVIDLVKGLYLDGLKTPEHYDDDPAEAVVLFCGRFLQLMLYRAALQGCRLFIAETDTFPEAAAGYYDAIFKVPHERLAAFLRERYHLAAKASADIAQELLGRMMYPRLVGALLGTVKTLPAPPDAAAIATDVDLGPVRRAVAALLPSGDTGPR